MTITGPTLRLLRGFKTVMQNGPSIVAVLQSHKWVTDSIVGSAGCYVASSAIAYQSWR